MIWEKKTKFYLTITSTVFIWTENVFFKHFSEFFYMNFKPFELFEINKRFTKKITNELKKIFEIYQKIIKSHFTVMNLLSRQRSIPHHSRANVAKPASIYNRAWSTSRNSCIHDEISDANSSYNQIFSFRKKTNKQKFAFTCKTGLSAIHIL